MRNERKGVVRLCTELSGIGILLDHIFFSLSYGECGKASGRNLEPGIHVMRVRSKFLPC